MARGFLLVMSFWLFCLWFAGMGISRAGDWLTWSIGAVSLVLFFASLSLNPRLYGRGSILASLLSGVALVALWVIGMSSPTAPTWLSWWCLANGAALFVVSAIALNGYDMAIWTPDRSDEAPGGADLERLSA